MFKGTRCLLIVLLLAVEAWISSGQIYNLYPGQQFQRRKNVFHPPLRNGQYMLPIPITLPPNFLPHMSESITREASADNPPKLTSSIESPWVPLQNEDLGQQKKNNAYKPINQASPDIITRKPIKSTFDIPLTKTIQVTQGKPKVQSTGYIRKNLVKVHATRTTTENPMLKIFGQLAESTVQTLLNFTPIDAGWRPKSPTTSRPRSHFDFGRNLGSKVDSHLNYTGIRFGKINSLLEAKPAHGAGVETTKNETNFVMRFTPDDIKYTSVEVKTANIDSPLHVGGAEIKQLNEDYKDQRIYFDGLSEEQRSTADLRKKINLPHPRIPIKRPSATMSSTPEKPRTVFHDFDGVQRYNAKSRIRPIQSQKPFLANPYNAVKINSALIINNSYQNTNVDNADKTKINQNAGSNLNKDHRNHFVQPYIRPNIGKQINTKHLDQDIPSPPNKNPPLNIPTVEVNIPQDRPSTLFRIQPNTYNARSNSYKYNETRNKDVLSTAAAPHLQIVKYGQKLRHHQDQRNVANPKINNLHQNRSKAGLKPERVTFRNSSPNPSTLFAISHGDFKHNGQEISKPVFDQARGFREVELKNPPRYLQFDDVDVPKSSISEKSGNISEDKTKTVHVLAKDKSEGLQNPSIAKSNEMGKVKLSKDINLHETHTPTLKVDYNKKELSSPNKFSKETIDSAFFQPVFPEVARKNFLEGFQQMTGNHNGGQTPGRNHISSKEISFNPPQSDNFNLVPIIAYDPSKDEHMSMIDRNRHDGTRKNSLYSLEDPTRNNRPSLKDGLDRSIFHSPENPRVMTDRVIPGISVKNFSAVMDGKVSKNSIHSTDESRRDNGRGTSEESVNDYSIIADGRAPKNTLYSPEDIRRNNGGSNKDLSMIITSPPVITTNFDPKELESATNKKNITDNYVIQRKPSLFPGTSGKPRKPKITISTGMLAGILIAALVFLGFLTGSMVYAFHQWKFGRGRGERPKKKSCNPGFPPEYLDENFAGNTYIHNNIFLPTPQNMEERSPSDPESSSMTGEDVVSESQIPPSRTRRQLGTFREIREQ